MSLPTILRVALMGSASIGVVHADEAHRFGVRQPELTARSNDEAGRFSVRATSSLRPAANEQARFQLKAALVDCALGEAIFADGFEGNTQ